MKYLSFIFLITTILVACNTRPVGSHPTPVVIDTEYCGAAEQNLKKLGCIPKNAPYTQKGKSFTQFCEETQNHGVFLNPKCLSTMTTCKQDVCTLTKTN